MLIYMPKSYIKWVNVADSLPGFFFMPRKHGKISWKGQSGSIYKFYLSFLHSKEIIKMEIITIPATI